MTKQEIGYVSNARSRMYVNDEKTIVNANYMNGVTIKSTNTKVPKEGKVLRFQIGGIKDSEKESNSGVFYFSIKLNPGYYDPTKPRTRYTRWVISKNNLDHFTVSDCTNYEAAEFIRNNYEPRLDIVALNKEYFKDNND